MLLKFLAKYRDTGLLILRLGLGILFVVHGLPKLQGGPGGWAKLGAAIGNLGIHFWFPFWGFMSAITETLGGIFLVLGLFYRPVCLLLTFNMLVALLFHYHKHDPFLVFSHPLELIFVFFGLAFIGPGRFSIDKD